jgi:hypothetical protein
MKREKQTARHGTWLLRLGATAATALIAVILATSLLPLSSHQAAAEDDDLKIVAVEATIDPPADDEEDKVPVVVEPVLISDDGIIVNPEPPDDDPVIDDVTIVEEPEVEETPELGDPVALGGVQINKLWCDADYGADYATLATNCDSGGGATFHVQGSYDEQTFEAGYFEADLATPDTIAVVEDIPAGYGAPIVFCAIYANLGGGGAFDLYQAEASWYSDAETASEHARVEADLGLGEYLYCDWFNIPSTDDGSITIQKWTCPVNYDIDGPASDPALDCTEPTDGITFSLLGDLGIFPDATTGEASEGIVYWGELVASNYQLDETVPDGMVAIVVTCTWYEGLGPYVYDTLIPIGTGVIDLSLAAGDDVVCDWYNIPLDDPDGGELIVIKYWCDDAIYTADACEPYGGDVEFILQPTTGDGQHEVSLPAGAYTLDEGDAEWCYASSPDVDAEGNVVVSDGHTSVVEVFNCGPGKKEPSAKNFPNNGTGPVNRNVQTLAPFGTAADRGPF